MSGGHPNPYAYAANDPVESADPSGTFPLHTPGFSSYAEMRAYMGALSNSGNGGDADGEEKGGGGSIIGAILDAPWNFVVWASGANQTQVGPGLSGFGSINGDPYRDGTEEGEEFAQEVDAYGRGCVAIGEYAAEGADDVLQNYAAMSLGIVGQRGFGNPWPSAGDDWNYGGYTFSKHALERMAPRSWGGRGIPTSVVLDVLRYGSRRPSNIAGRTIVGHNGVEVILEGNRIITIHRF